MVGAWVAWLCVVAGLEVVNGSDVDEETVVAASGAEVVVGVAVVAGGDVVLGVVDTVGAKQNHSLVENGFL